MPSLPPSVEELNPLIPSNEQLQKKLKEDFEASMAKVINNRKVSKPTRIRLEGLECMFAYMMDILRGCYTTGREEANRNVVDEIKVFINKVKAMKDLCHDNREVNLNKAINQAISSMHKLYIFRYLVGIYFPGDCKCPIEYRNRNLLDDSDYADHDFTEEGSPESGESDRDHLEEYSAAELSDKGLLDGFSVVEFCRQGSSEKFPLPKYSDGM
ncbi:hypothetical protein HG429_003710 [Candidatus Saccharibacteria bacterium]|nr:hypothetical protein [Candidatus Saccharibacteria bacterium]